MQGEPSEALSLRDTVLLGLVHGPAELLPISSSAHINLVPWFGGWHYLRLDPELRKSVEVALHAGAAMALLIGQRQLLAAEIRAIDGRRLAVLALSFAPAAVVGLALERPIERRLGGPAATAVGLLGGALAMAVADRWPGAGGNGGAAPQHSFTGGAARRGPRQMIGRGHREAGWRDGLALGLAQAAALMPGVSRNGATLAAARRRGFSREDANLLSRVIALPVIAGASLLKGIRLCRRGVDRRQRLILGAGVLASLVSTLASQRLILMVERDRALWPYAAYRSLLAVAVLRRHARNIREGRDGNGAGS